MAKELYGYTGKLLRVNMSDHSYSVEDMPQKIRDMYLGGRGFLAKYCYDEIKPGIDPLSPENKIFFTLGAFSGTRFVASGRYVVGGISPHSKTYTRSVSGGIWGAHLKWTGYDMLIVEGASPAWVYLYITDDGVEFRSAEALLGLTTEETENAIREELGNKRVASVSIGPAGEKLVTMACIQSDRRSAGRGGCGCLMGSKKLKAIAAFGTKKPKIYDEETFNRRNKEFVQTNTKTHWYNHFHPYGSMTGCDTTYNLSIHPIKNFQYSTNENMHKLLKEGVRALQTKVKDTGCYNCYLRCASIHNVPEGPFKGEGYENPEYETMWSFGANCLNFDVPAILMANKICDDLGVDTISAGVSVAFLMECYEKGLISKDDLNGVELKWGDAIAMCEVAKQICLRSSRLGNIIADGGVRHAAEVIGQGSEKFAMHAKGLELAAYDPRGAKAHGVGYATSPIGGSHQIGYGTAEIFGMPEKVDRFTPYGKGDTTIWSNRLIMCGDTAVSCGFATGFTPENLREDTYIYWLDLIAGPNENMKEKQQLLDAFDRIFNLETAINLRLGLGDEDNDLPDRLKSTTLPDGLSKGQVWERDILIPEYYEARGWTKEGVPSRATLSRLGIEEVADDLEERGIRTT